MPYSPKPFTCVDCGEPTVRRRANGAQVRCPLCAIAYSAEVIRQLHARSGPIFDKWLLANAAGAARSIAYSEFMLLSSSAED